MNDTSYDEEPAPDIPYIRQDVWKLDRQGPDGKAIIDAYATAVGVLKAGGPLGARSWVHQTQVHGMFPDPHDGLRNTCQHSSWYFLPWHRMYLGYFEAICREIIRSRPEISPRVKDTWALPYWDYDTATTNTLPEPFRTPLRAGSPNPLYDGTRKPPVNAGTAALTPAETRARGWYYQAAYTSGNLPVPSFGGPTTGFNHEGGPIGSLEGTPHGAVHNFVGGDMWDFNHAANDPVFWLHHSNIDRLWEVWRSHTGRGGDPARNVFTQRFAFLDPSGARVDPESAQVLETSSFNYVYADIGVPASAGPPPIALRRRPVAGAGVGDEAEGPSEEALAEQRRRATETPPEAVAVNREPVSLAAGTATVDIAVGPGAARDLTERAVSPEHPERLLLFLDHITQEGDEQPASYAVYIGDEADDDKLVGILPLFGLRESQADDAAHGLSYAFDITDVAAGLDDASAGRLHLSFHPVVHDDDAPPPPEVVVKTVRLMVQ